MGLEVQCIMIFSFDIREWYFIYRNTDKFYKYQQPENVLLLSKNRQHIKLIDFGLSRMITEAEEVRDLMGM